MKPRDKRIKHSLFSWGQYVLFFLLISFVVTCSFLLFIDGLDINLEQLDIRRSAITTFVNILLLSVLFTVMYSIWRMITVERPVKRILRATRQVTRGDFSARIAPLHGLNGANEFDAIIDDFNRMAAELSGIETLRTDFIASVSHELKTPLTVMQNYATLLQDADLSETDRLAYAKTIATASQRLSGLIENVLRLSKLENQQIFPQKKPYDLGEQLRACLLGFEEVWEEKGIEIDVDIEDVSIQADAELLGLVWNNLISNALKFTEPGGRVAVSLKGGLGGAVVEVSDTGCGMPPEVGQHIFEKFYQGDVSRAMQGNGLGLALVKRVMDIVGGDISVQSAVGRGSTFTVVLGEEER